VSIRPIHQLSGGGPKDASAFRTHAVAAFCVVPLLLQLSSSRSGEHIIVSIAVQTLALGICAWLSLARSSELPSVRTVICWGVLLRLLALPITPPFEDDYFRYLWDGYQTFHARTPFGIAPETAFGDGSIPEALRAVLAGINHPELPTIYGPALQYLFAVAAALAPGSLVALKGVLLACDIALLCMLARHCAPASLLLYAWNPLVISEVAINAHADGFVALLLLTAAESAWRSRWTVSGAILGVAFAAKAPLAVLAAPVMLAEALTREARLRSVLHFGAGAILATVAMYGPFLLRDATELDGLRVFATQWEFNAGAFGILRYALGDTPARATAALLIAAVTIIVSWLHQQSRSPAERRLHSALVIVILATLWFSPAVNPWYLLWALPLAAARRAIGPWLVSAVLPLAYLHGDTLLRPEWMPFEVPLIVRAIEHSVLAIAIATEVRRWASSAHFSKRDSRRSRRQPEQRAV
jgi:alpha-1,6-mannosyltransferase